MFDLAIIGGGPAGYVAAERAAEMGRSVVLFEKRELGGVCLNEGCIPTKTLLYSAKTYAAALHADRYAVSVEGAGYDYGKIIDRKNRTVRRLVGGIAMKMRACSVEVVKAEATIKGSRDGAFVVEAAQTEYQAAHLLLCTGSTTFVPPIAGLAEAGDRVVTNREILASKECPKSIAIIGGGVIGMEFAGFFNALGVKVSVIEMLPEILGAMDNQLGALLRQTYAKQGVDFYMECRVAEIRGGEVLFTRPDATQTSVEAERILVSVGRRAVTAGLGLESLGVKMERGAVVVDSRMQTNIEGVYAAGDITGFSMLAHTASREAEVAVNNMFGTPEQMRYDTVAGIVYTSPEVAGVGLTEQAARQSGTEIEIASLPMTFSGRFMAENDGVTGLCKIIAAKSDGRILGVHMMGNPASEIIYSAALAIECGMSVESWRRSIFPHPTVGEIIKETLYAFK